MFLKKSTTTIKGKTYHHYKVVASYRQGGKVKHRILFPVGALTDEQAERLRMAIAAHSDPEIVVANKEDIVVTKHAAYLNVAVLQQLWQQWNFDRFFQADRWVKALVFNRCLEPVSKIKVKDWLTETVLPAYLAIDILQTDAYDVYRELDRLSRREAELQSFVYRRLKLERPDWSDTFFYDITSTYLEGSRCVLATLGYSRDHRPDCEQIVIALMITPEGYPFYWRVLPGNTQDITTIKDMVKDVKRRYGVTNCIMVFDRGMVSTQNLMTLEDEKWAYVSAMDRDEIATSDFFEEALPEPATPEDWEQIMDMQGFFPFDENGFLYFREFQIEDRRYILAFDVARFLHEHELQAGKLNQVLEWIKKKNQSLAQAQKARKQAVLEREIQDMRGRKGVKKFMDIQINPHTHTVSTKKGLRAVQSFQLSYTIDQKALQKAQRLHGVTCFITNLPKDRRPATEVIKWYRDKNKVEEAFHEIKSHLELRPIFLSREQRVRAHVSVCVLAYFLYNDMERRLTENKVSMSPEEVLKLLGSCQINRITIKDTNQTYLSHTELSTPQKEILRALGCESAVDPKQIKQILKKAENWL